MLLIRIISLIIFGILSFFVENQRDYIEIYYPPQVTMLESCEGENAEFVIEISTNSKKPLQIYSFDLGIKEYELYSEKGKIASFEKLILTENTPIKLRIKYKISYNITEFKFKTNVKRCENNSIELRYGGYLIEAKDIKVGKEQIVNITNSCTDAIKIYFPYGGTISNVELCQDSIISPKACYKSIEYQMFAEDNYITLSKLEKNRYYVRFNSCNWGNEFWLRLE